MLENPRKDPRPPARPVRPVPADNDANQTLETRAGDLGGVSTPPKKWRPGCFSIVAAIFALIIGFGVLSGGLGDSDAYELEATCQILVRDNLKSPSSAKFIGVPESDGTYIWGEVDAQNSFGAVVRSSFQCTIIDSETVRLDFIR